MTDNPKSLLPPVPRGSNEPTVSEMIPFKSTKINIWKSKALAPLFFVAIAVTVLFATMTKPLEFIDVIAVTGTLILFLSIYFYSGIEKNWTMYLLTAAITWFLFNYVFLFYQLFFRFVLPGNVDALKDNPHFIPNFIAYFFGVGLAEELLKATPILIALFLTFRGTTPPFGSGPSFLDLFRGGAAARKDFLFRALALRGPLDGLLMGFAGGAVFILKETLGQYVPNMIDKIVASQHDQALALLLGLELVIPRVLQGVSGHMAWAGIFGYFIGLAVRYPAHWIKLTLTGWCTVAVLHALWDTSDKLPSLNALGESSLPDFWSVILSVVTVIVFVACLVKAKQLDGGGASGSGGSILVGTPASGDFAMPRAAAPNPSTAPAADPVQGVLSMAQGLFARFTPPAGPAQPVAAPAVAPAAVEERFSIGTPVSRFALEVGRGIDFAALFGAAGAGAVGEITRHPTDPHILGLKNVGSSAWTSTTAQGATITVPPGKNVRIAAGTKLIFGPLTLDIQNY
jgi:RsiW-degrading membrane proteinase PrsW (M82 family)